MQQHAPSSPTSLGAYAPGPDCPLPHHRASPLHPHSKNQRVRARILYVDPESKKIVLTMQRGLVAGQLPPDFPAMGQVFAEASVLRVDPGLGLLCSLPSAAGQVAYPPGFAHISNAAEGKVKSLEKVRDKIAALRREGGATAWMAFAV